MWLNAEKSSVIQMHRTGPHEAQPGMDWQADDLPAANHPAPPTERRWRQKRGGGPHTELFLKHVSELTREKDSERLWLDPRSCS